MEYDDNDYQSQNLHVAGEESSKVSPVLHPYTIPRFDFDESLQGQLRFDSLVENEVFLGIPSQEDNHWIEDFSRGNSGIQFSTSAAESCSIPRHNNVWSEATSSESVEMLLKSVGQEETVPEEAIAVEANASNELGNLNKEMEPDPKHDDKIIDVKYTIPSLPTDNSVGSISEVGNDTGEFIQFKPSSQTQEAELSAYGSSNMGAPAVREEKFQTELKFHDACQEEACTSLKESTSNESQGNLCGRQTFNTESLSNATTSSGKLDDQNKLINIHSENSKDLRGELCKVVDEQGKETSLDGENLSIVAAGRATGVSLLGLQPAIASNVEATKGQMIDTSTLDSREPSGGPLNGKSDLMPLEGCNQMNTSEPPEQMEVKLQSSVASQVDTGAELHAVDIGKINVSALHATPEAEEDSVGPISWEESSCTAEKVNLPESATEPDTGVAVASSEASLECQLHDESSKPGDGSIIGYAGSHGVFMDTSLSDGFGGDKSVDENLKEGNDAVIHKDNLVAEDQSPHAVESGRMQMGGQDSSIDQTSIRNEDLIVSASDQEKMQFPTDSGNIEIKTLRSPDQEKGAGSSSLSEANKGNVETAHGFEFDATIGSESVSGHDDVEAEVCNQMDKELSFSPKGGSEHFDENKEVKLDAETNILVLDESSDKQAPCCDAEKDSDYDAVEGVPKINNQSIHKSDISSQVERVGFANEATPECFQSMDIDQKDAGNPTLEAAQGIVNQPLHASENSDKRSQVEQVKDANKANEGFQRMEVASSDPDPTVMEGDGVEEVALKTHKDGAIRIKSAEARDGGSCQEVSNHGHDLATVAVSCSDLSQRQLDNEDIVKGVVEHVSVSDSTNEPRGKAPTSMNPDVVDGPKGDENFTFDVNPSSSLSEGKSGKELLSFPSSEACEVKIGESLPLASGISQMTPKGAQEIVHGGTQTDGKGTPSRAGRGASERKGRRGSGKLGNENSKKGNNAKEATPGRSSERGNKSCVSMTQSGTGQLMQFEVGNVECSTKPGGVIPVPTSNLPDLNTSAPASVLFQQPFTDLQQVQLRAQIFVYGSLIQGTAPDEACMLSAFGPSDAARSMWEPAWRACLERLHGQKPHATNPETPVQSRSGAKTPDQSHKPSLNQSKTLSSAASRMGGKGPPSPAVNPMIPLSSPLWNISTPSSDGIPSNGMPRGSVLDYQSLSPFHPYPSPPMRNFVGHTTPWLSQAPFPGAWVASPQTAGFEINSRLPAMPVTEPVKLMPVKESSAPLSSGPKHAPQVPVIHGANSNVLTPAASPLDGKKMTASSAQHSADPKSRKRKKTNVKEDIGGQFSSAPTPTEPMFSPVINTHLSRKAPADDLSQMSLLARTHTGSLSGPLVNSQFSTSVAVTAPSNLLPSSNFDRSLTALSPLASSSQPKSADFIIEKRTSNLEDFSKVEEAKLHAEEAAAHAVTAVSHCQDMWAELNKQKANGLMSDVEAKVASAAAAVAAASCVAKAAAAAAKIASNAALQAKLMADEALILQISSNPTPSSAVSFQNSTNNLGSATPASILKGGDGKANSGSIIYAAREAARKRIEAASAASKQAENLEAIVKAAELAAEAVSHAGKVVAMGDPLLLADLMEAGPEGYWRINDAPSTSVKSKGKNGDKSNINNVDGPGSLVKQSGAPSDKEMHTRGHGLPPLPRGNDTISEDKQTPAHVEKDSRGQKRRKASDFNETAVTVPESDHGPRSFGGTHENVANSLKDNSIKEGSLVEVFRDSGDLGGAWYSAKVLNLREGKAFVSYTEVQSTEGSGQLREWVATDTEGNKVPPIRIPHPMTTTLSDGTRKRRRVAAKDFVWGVGDRVDAWIQDSWREGVITEKNKKDETVLTIHFPAQGDTSVVRAWHLRPTLIWKDGEWIEWSTSRQDAPQGDTPHEKRPKLGSPAIESKGKGKIPKNLEFTEPAKPEESRFLPLSDNEKIFHVGSNKDDNKPNTLRTMRSGLQKEGSKIIFGVPKPGKKKKFMEVSKHYVSERNTKNNVTNDSAKVAKSLIPQGSGPRGWKNSRTDSKDKQTADAKAKALKSRKLPSVSSRTLKGSSLTSSISAANNATSTDDRANDSISCDENESSQQKLGEFRTFSNVEEAGEDPILFSQVLPTDASKKGSSLTTKSERLNKGNFINAGGKSVKVEAKDKSMSEVVEPRRSNRRIQPTSRLLEGLQSSLIISKIPAVSHDKSNRSHNRATSKGNNNHH